MSFRALAVWKALNTSHSLLHGRYYELTDALLTTTIIN